MSFLDNLESTLKNLESQEQGAEEAGRQQRTREAERASALAAAPYAEELKKGPYTTELLRLAARIGHEMRVKVHIAWLGATLRLEARGSRLELRPTAEGVVAVWMEGLRETHSQPVDLKGQPEEMLREWLGAGAVGAPDAAGLAE